ncbi:MAG: hypothetical protein WAK72_03225, partial [Pseudolabrys sp.]
MLAAIGNSNWKIEPPFALGDTQIRPSWFSMIDWQIERPIPIPRALVVNIGLKSWANVGRLNARPGVFDRHMHFIGLAQFGFYAQHASLRRTHCLDGIHDQVQNHLL